MPDFMSNLLTNCMGMRFCKETFRKLPLSPRAFIVHAVARVHFSRVLEKLDAGQPSLDTIHAVFIGLLVLCQPPKRQQVSALKFVHEHRVGQ